MKNVFHFILKAFFVLKTFKFLYWLFAYVKKRFDQNDTVNFKIYDITTWLINSYNTYIFPNISQSKDHQTIKFDQLIEYNKTNIFLQTSCRNWGSETTSLSDVLTATKDNSKTFLGFQVKVKLWQLE